MRAVAIVAFGFLSGLLASGCAGFQHFPWFDSQRWPGPMEAAQNPLPGGDATRYPKGPEEVRILRHADPVQVRMAGSAGSIPLSYKRKELRVSSGSGVQCSGGGRAEVLWPNGSSAVLFGFTDGIVGSPSRGEPSFILRDIDQVRFDPKSEDLYELLGGVRLRVGAGPVRVTRPRRDVMNIANESKRSAQVAFRDATIVLDPGQAVELPILTIRAPVAEDNSTGERKLSTTQGPGFTLEAGEGATATAEAGGLVARGNGVVRALGVQIALAPGTEARFSGLVRAPTPTPAEPPSPR